MSIFIFHDGGCLNNVPVMRKGSSHGAHEHTQSDAAGNRPAIANLQHAAPSATPLAYAAIVTTTHYDTRVAAPGANEGRR